MTPNHRALTDAQATVDVLHGLMERVGNLGVHTLEDLQEFSRQVSPQRRSKRTWAAGLPETAGVYLFVAEHPAGRGRREAQRHVLYVGKSKNLRARVRTYFTAAEKRRRMDEMVRLATGVETIPCQTQLQADVLELRLIAAHAPRYNRRSKFPERTSWVKITDEAFPRLSIVTGVRDDGATYFGPFPRRQAAEDVVLAVYDGFPLRQCTARLSPTRPVTACALAGMGRCCAPCDGSVGREEYAALVERVRDALCSDARPAVAAVSARLTRLVGERRFEEAETIRRRLETLGRTARRFHRVSSLAACPEIVAARREGAGLGHPRHPLRPAGQHRRRRRRTTSRRPWPAAPSRPPRPCVRPRPPAGRRHRGDRTDRRLARAAGRPAHAHRGRLGLAAARRARPRDARPPRARRRGARSRSRSRQEGDARAEPDRAGSAEGRHSGCGGPGETSPDPRMADVVTAIVFINAEVARISEVAEAVAALPGVSEVYSVTGALDLVAIVRVGGPRAGRRGRRRPAEQGARHPADRDPHRLPRLLGARPRGGLLPWRRLTPALLTLSRRPSTRTSGPATSR